MLPESLITRARAECPDGAARFTLVYPRLHPGAGRLMILTAAEAEKLLARVATMTPGSLERAAAEQLYLAQAMVATADGPVLTLPDRLLPLFVPLPCAVTLKPAKIGFDLVTPARDSA
jgi:hypothetical protein